MAGSCFTVGVAAPLAATFAYSRGEMQARTVVIAALAWIILATVPRIGGQRMLGRLRE